ncbi:hypothetical protein [Mycobacterium sp. NPDC050853]|uniref:hypothetical protein n=1 Tax=Mycobacterium sp. NPDC050853 TaxID=3155160 RepID=UPI0034091136
MTREQLVLKPYADAEKLLHSGTWQPEILLSGTYPRSYTGDMPDPPPPDWPVLGVCFSSSQPMKILIATTPPSVLTDDIRKLAQDGGFTRLTGNKQDSHLYDPVRSSIDLAHQPVR